MYVCILCIYVCMYIFILEHTDLGGNVVKVIEKLQEEGTVGIYTHEILKQLKLQY